MFRTRFVAVAALAVAVLIPAGWRLANGEEAANSELIKMIGDLLTGDDRDMRALGLQQVREESPGEAATLEFASLLPKLKPEVQSGLLEALGDRGDRAARPAVLQMISSDQDLVRAAAIQAMGALGTEEDIPMLAEKTAAKAKGDSDAARSSLVRMRGEKVNAAILAALAKSNPQSRAVLLNVLAARNAKEAVPAVLEQAGDKDPQVRSAALDALRQLADVPNTEALVVLVKGAASPEMLLRAELALRTVCGRGRDACVAPILAARKGAKPEADIVLLRALARAGGAKALEAISAESNSTNDQIRNEAVRLVCNWPDPSVTPTLLQLAAGGKDLRTRVLAIRGLVRMAAATADGATDVELLKKTLSLSNRAAEKRLVLGTLGNSASPAALHAATLLASDPEVGQEAALAMTLVAEKMPPADLASLSTQEKVAVIFGLGNRSTLEAFRAAASLLDDPNLGNDAAKAAAQIAEKLSVEDIASISETLTKISQSAKDPTLRDRIKAALERK